MSDIDRIVAREEDTAFAMYEAGEISDEEYRKALKEIYNGAQTELEARAEEAYNNVMRGG